MNLLELKGHLSTFLNSDHLCLTVYFLLKNGDITLADINRNILPEIKDLYLKNLYNDIINKEDYDLLNLSEADERKNVLYKYDFKPDISPISEMSDLFTQVERPKFRFSDHKLENIEGIITRIGNSSSSIFFYTKMYNVNLIKQDKSLKLIPAQTRFEKFEQQVLRITGKFELFTFMSEYFILNYELLEKYYKFEEVIRERAISSINDLRRMALVEELSYLGKTIENTRYAKKFVKIMLSSPVVTSNLGADVIISFAKQHPKLMGKFKFNQDNSKFVLDTNISCQSFLKLLDDDFLKSGLTGNDYETLAKNAM